MNSLRFIIQEIARAEESERIMTFPRQLPPHLDLLREREQLSLREEGDFDFGDDEEEDEDELENGDDLEELDEEDADPVRDDADFLTDTATDPDEEEPEE
jgi:hypothetical protein